MLWILEEKFIKVYQGLKEDNWIFNDEKDIKKFCSLSELGKEALEHSQQLIHPINLTTRQKGW